MAPYVAAELGDPAEIPGSMPERLTELLAPTLIFHGKRDAAVPPAFATPAGNLILSPKSSCWTPDIFFR
ncbi:MAG TPA: hypothetical protein VGF88_13365 [Acidobacteriaceae bacterium]|jgi:fermentation-respiration switch protein FrsA (DUF1100 family)